MLAPYAVRIERRRARDSYFDALCVTYLDIEGKLAALAGRLDKESVKIAGRLRDQRSGLLDTILFLLEDHGTMHKHAA